MSYRTVVSGTRLGRRDAEYWFEWIVKEYGEPVLWIAGGAKGVDTQCEDWCNDTNRSFQKFEADWETFGKKAGSIRNGVMVEFAVEVPNSRLLALPVPTSIGTYNCVKQAQKAKLKVDVK